MAHRPGQPMRIEAIYVSPVHAFRDEPGWDPAQAPMVPVREVECVAGRGLRGDRYFDRDEGHKGQVTFFSVEVWEDLCRTLRVTGRDPSVFRRNVVVRGVDLNGLIGREFEVQGVRFRGVEEARPCRWMNRAFGEGAEVALRGRGGLRGRILGGGTLRAESPARGPVSENCTPAGGW